ncbi:MAG: AAA family ATPase [Microcoleus sp. PH2017_39_LGB_O_B]|uniref:AAA family ATPase n=1 Tax=unclassified Microcoleus TaxID=2642155 RepID=UPI001DAA19C6|nr:MULTISPECIES: AAA family ATPase [unclassified Microcoleus]MCC3448205.1 AAA family ATPase [Microcoleus sp. PH2017_09_SFU_O_A]MCC3629143.1 AAA family ATPase [Microcoleus sp. PH2017_39_LGB_O_B]MCC3641228.1 AAA family ATPase [Microcoleus sp. PH2017_33_LGB_O_A]TAF86637.1 MAG: ATP-binding cassette domain-containing protein [Oscillatoriales cyanobacterium]
MYIRKIEIKNFRGNDFSWILHTDVNVLIGKNGSGKSTILRMLNEAVWPEDSRLNFRLFDPIDKMIIELENDIVIVVDSASRSITGNQGDTSYHLKTNLINTFDVVEKSSDPNTTLLDFHLNKLKQEFIIYQRDLLNQVEAILTSDYDRESRNDKLEEIESIYKPKNIFLKILSELFNQTGKKFDEKAFNFLEMGSDNPISPESLSSGEKQILIILFTTLLQDKKPYILLMDEPEISLHIDWQRSLIQHIRQINPICQIIMATHSPTTYYQGWIEKVSRIEEIQSPSNLVVASEILEEKTFHSKERVQNIKDEFNDLSGNKLAQLYQFNRKINTYTSFTKDESILLLDFLKDRAIYPDVITFTTLISKLNNYEDAKEIFDLMESETYTRLHLVKPNDITLNTLIKKVNGVREGIDLIQSLSANGKLQLYPDIITFSTLLGKAKNADEIKLLEEVRNYYGVKANDIYLNKLSSKR